MKRIILRGFRYIEDRLHEDNRKAADSDHIGMNSYWNESKKIGASLRKVLRQAKVRKMFLQPKCDRMMPKADRFFANC
jgi:hypothetical protein